MRRQNKTEFAILGLLSIKPMSGYDMKLFIAGSLNYFWTASYGQLYPTLKQLHNDGFISKEIKSKESKPNRHVYKLNKKGEKKLKEWLIAEIEPEPNRSELLLKFFFGINVDNSDMIKHLNTTLKQQSKQLKTYRQIEKSILEPLKDNPSYIYWLSTVKFGIYNTQAQIKWCNEMILLLKNKL